MAIVGSAHVEIHADTSALRGEITRGMQSALAGIKSDIKLTLDASGVMAELALIRAELDALTNRTHTISVDVDSAAALHEMTIIQAQMARIDGRRLNVHVDVDSGGLGLAALLGLSRGADAADQSFGGFRAKIIILATLIAGLLGPALGLVAGAIAALPGLIAIAGAAIGVIALGMDGIKAAAEEMSPALGRLKELMSATFENNLRPVFADLGGLLDDMTDGLHGIAHALVGVMEGIRDVVTESSNVDAITETLANVRQGFEAATPGIKSFVDSFIVLGAVGSQAMIGLAGEFTRATGEFNTFIHAAADTGLLTAAMDGLVASFSGFFDLINSLMFAGIELSAIIFDDLGRAFTALGDLFEASVPLLAALGQVFLTIVSVLANLLIPLLEAMGPHLMVLSNAITGGLTAALTALSPYMTQIGELLGQMLVALIPLIDPMIRIAVILAEVLVGALQAVMPLVVAVADALALVLGAALTAIEPLIPIIVEAMMALSEALMPIIPIVAELAVTLIEALAPILPPIVQAISDLAVAFAPLLVLLVDVAAQIITALVPILPIMADLFIRVVEAIIPLFPLLMDIVEAALPPLLRLIEAISPILPVLADAFIMILDAVMPLIPPLLRIIELILPPLIDLFTWLVENLLADAIPAIEAIAEEIEIWAGVLETVLLAVEEFVAGVVDFFSDFENNIQTLFDSADQWLRDAGDDIVQGLEDGVSEAWDGFLEWAEGLWQDFVDGFEEFFGIQSPSTVFAGFGDNIMQGLENGMSDAKESVIGFATTFGEDLNAEFDTAITELGTFWDESWANMGTWFSGHMDGIVSTGDQKTSDLDSNTRTKVSGLSGWWDTSWKGVRDVFGGHLDGVVTDGDTKNAKLDSNTRSKVSALSGWWDTSWSDVRGFFAGHLEGVVTDGNTKNTRLDANTKSTISGLSGWWNTAFAGVRSAFAGHAEGVVTDGSTKMGRLDTNTRSTMGGLKSWWDGHWNGMVTAFDTIFTRIGGVASRIWTGIVSTFKTQINSVLGFINGMITGVNKVLSYVKLPPLGTIQLLETGGTLDGVQLLAQGGRVGEGFVTNGPRAIVGEGNPNYPEFVIPTDPKYRRRAQALTQAAASKVGLLAEGGQVDGNGVRLMEDGGVLDWLKEVGSGAVGAVANVASNIANGAMGAFDNIASWISGGVSATINKVAGAVKDQMPNTLPGDVGRGGVDMIAGGLTSIITSAQKAIEAAALAAAEFGSSGSSPVGVGGLGPQAAAARAYTLANFGGISSIGGYSYRTIAGTNQLSDHALGKAIDVMIANYRSAEGISAGNRIANHFVTNPGQFGTKYVIWRDQINSGSGWKPYGHPSGAGGDTLQHRDHVHVSFYKKGGILDQLNTLLGGTAPRQMLMDTGGWLPTGTTMVQNNTGRAEAVIADPITSFKNAFYDVFAWFSPRVESAIEGSFDRGYSKTASVTQEMIDFWRSNATKEGFQITRADNTARPATTFGPGLRTAPAVIDPPAIRMVTGSLGDALRDSFTRLAPELSMALQVGAREQIASFGTELLGNQARLDAITADVAAAMGTPIEDIRATIAAIANSAVPGSALPAVYGTPTAAMADAQSTISSTTTTNSSPSVTIEAGAMQVTIGAGADAVTVAQLQQVLTDFQDQLAQEIVGSR